MKIRRDDKRNSILVSEDFDFLVLETTIMQFEIKSNMMINWTVIDVSEVSTQKKNIQFVNFQFLLILRVSVSSSFSLSSAPKTESSQKTFHYRFVASLWFRFPIKNFSFSICIGVAVLHPYHSRLTSEAGLLQKKLHLYRDSTIPFASSLLQELSSKKLSLLTSNETISN